MSENNIADAVPAKRVLVQNTESIILPFYGQKDKEGNEFCRIFPGEREAYETENPDDEKQPPFIRFSVKLNDEDKFLWVGMTRKALEENFSGKVKIIDNPFT